MNPTATMIRWYRQTTGGTTTQQEQFTPEEVLQLLHPDHEDEGQQEGTLARRAVVYELAAQPGTWLGRLTKQHRMEIGELADRLPSVLFHHSTGGQPGELMQQFGGWSTWRYERALEVAASCIAGSLNQTRMVA
jgi:hypothetical protein